MKRAGVTYAGGQRLRLIHGLAGIPRKPGSSAEGEPARASACKMGTRAFTLVELLVVIAIIGLLISIMLPSLSAARDQAKSVKCKSQLRTFGSSSFAYATEMADFLCSGQADARENMNLDPGITDLALTGIDKVGWIADFVNGKYCFPGQMLCPSNPGRQTQSWGRALNLPGALDAYPPEEFAHLKTERAYNTNYCQSWYMIHSEYDGFTSLVVDHDKMRGSVGPLRLTTMIRATPSRVPLFGDARAPRDELFDHGGQGYGAGVRETKSATDGPGWQENEDGTYTMMPYTSATPYGIQDWDDFGPAHRRRGQNEEDHGFTVANILFGDGHVESFEDRFDFDNGVLEVRPDGELDSWDLREKVFDGVLSLGRRSRSVAKME